MVVTLTALFEACLVGRVWTWTGGVKMYYYSISLLVVQFVAESRFANCEFANLFFDFDELQFS